MRYGQDEPEPEDVGKSTFMAGAPSSAGGLGAAVGLEARSPDWADPPSFATVNGSAGRNGSGLDSPAGGDHEELRLLREQLVRENQKVAAAEQRREQGHRASWAAEEVVGSEMDAEMESIKLQMQRLRNSRNSPGDPASWASPPPPKLPAASGVSDHNTALEQELARARAELSALNADSPPPAAASPGTRLFSAMDRDGDGMVTSAELTAGLGAAGSTAAAALLFSAADRDGDGVITRDEMRAGLSTAAGRAAAAAVTAEQEAAELEAELAALREQQRAFTSTMAGPRSGGGGWERRGSGGSGPVSPVMAELAEAKAELDRLQQLVGNQAAAAAALSPQPSRAAAPVAIAVRPGSAEGHARTTALEDELAEAKAELEAELSGLSGRRDSEASQPGVGHTSMQAPEPAPVFVDRLALMRGLAPGGQSPAAAAAAAAESRRHLGSSSMEDAAANATILRMEELHAQRRDGLLSDAGFEMAINALVGATAQAGPVPAGPDSDENLYSDDEAEAMAQAMALSLGQADADTMREEGKEAAAVERSTEEARRRRRAQMAADHGAKQPGSPSPRGTSSPRNPRNLILEEAAASPNTTMVKPSDSMGSSSSSGRGTSRQVELLLQAESQVAHAERELKATADAAEAEQRARIAAEQRERAQAESTRRAEVAGAAAAERAAAEAEKARAAEATEVETARRMQVAEADSRRDRAAKLAAERVASRAEAAEAAGKAQRKELEERLREEKDKVVEAAAVAEQQLVVHQEEATAAERARKTAERRADQARANQARAGRLTDKEDDYSTRARLPGSPLRPRPVNSPTRNAVKQAAADAEVRASERAAAAAAELAVAAEKGRDEALVQLDDAQLRLAELQLLQATHSPRLAPADSRGAPAGDGVAGWAGGLTTAIAFSVAIGCTYTALEGRSAGGMQRFAVRQVGHDNLGMVRAAFVGAFTGLACILSSCDAVNAVRGRDGERRDDV